MPESLEGEIRVLRAQYWSDRDPDGRAFAPLAEAYRRQGNLDEAAALVQEGIERLPDFTAGYVVSARIARDRGDLLGARGCLDRVLELDPENVPARFDRVALALEEGDREGALADLRIVLDLDPGHREAAHRLEEIQTAEVHVPTAIEPSEVEGPSEVPVSELHDDDPDPAALFTRTMGDLYAAQGFLDRAVEVYEHLSRRNPGDVELRERLAALQARGTSTSAAGEPAARSPRSFAIAPDEDGPALAGSPAELAGRPIRSYFGDLLAWVPGAVPIASLAPDPLPEFAELGDPVPVALLAPDQGE